MKGCLRVSALALCLAVIGCGDGSAPGRDMPSNAASGAPTSDDQYRYRRPELDTANIAVQKSLPPKVRVYLAGRLPADCSELHEVRQRRDGRTLYVDVISRSPRGRECPADGARFEHSLRLDLEGLEAGSYTVVANNLRRELEVTDAMLRKPR